MSYQSPINVIYKGFEIEFEDGVYKAVARYGINVDKEELLKALAYDREQYDIGWLEGCLHSRYDAVRRIEKLTRYRISEGELVEGAYNDSEALYRAEDIFKAISIASPTMSQLNPEETVNNVTIENDGTYKVGE